MNASIGTLGSQKSKTDKTDTTVKIDTIRNFDAKQQELLEKQQQLRNAQLKNAAVTAAGTAAGAAIGSIFGPLGTLIGAGVGGWLGNQVAKDEIEELRNEIEEMSEELQEAWQKYKDAIGAGVEQIAGSLESALMDAATYDEFLTNFTGSLEQMTKKALIRAFMSSEAMSKLFDNLSDTVASAVLDGTLTDEEWKAIEEQADDIVGTVQPFFQRLNELFSSDNIPGAIMSSDTAMVRETISEQTGSKLVGLFSSSVLYLKSIDAHIQDIAAQLIKGVISVKTVETEGLDANEFNYVY
jgi:uncharacterized protein YcfJ